MIARKIQNDIVDLLKFYPALVLTGARQAGKTTLLQELFSDYNYVSLDVPSIAMEAEKDPSSFFKKYKAPLIIDEIQYSPGLFRNLKILIDKDRHNMGQYLLTGSQKFTLMKEVSESLAGRAVIMELENLSHSEIYSDCEIERLNEVICRGQFPALWRLPELPSSSFYRSYLSTYLERDIRQIVNIPNLHDFEKFMRLLATRSSQTLNKNDIAKSVGVSATTIQSWISVLEASNQIQLLQPWFHNFGKRLVKTPKIYFSDTGFLCYLLNLEADSLNHSPFFGAIWETFVYSEIRKMNSCQKNPANIWFYRDQRAREIDFVVEKNGLLSFVECQWSEFPNKEEAKVIHTINRELINSKSPWKPTTHYIIGNPPNSYPVNEICKVIPVSEIDKMLELN